MRKPIMAGNWKMNKTRDEALQFVLALGDKLPGNVDCVVCAPSILLRDLVKRAPLNLKIGAQNVNEHDSGAFTGEISPIMLKDTGVEYVIIGHSERRQYYNETNASVNAKIKKALEYGLKPIVCVGENLKEREEAKTHDVLVNQITEGLKDVEISNPENLVIAYEPIWAIGTGKSADAIIAEDACSFIRSVLANIFGPKVAESIRILYGGSVNTSNIQDYMKQPDVDGGLVGGASLNPDNFVTLSLAAKK